ncbi:MAG: hypothetical protein QXL86_03395 [Candidatus Aenigmatarchaeota archaeon]
MEYEIDCEKLKTELKGYKITTEELIELIKIYGKWKGWLKGVLEAPTIDKNISKLFEVMKLYD